VTVKLIKIQFSLFNQKQVCSLCIFFMSTETADGIEIGL